LHLDRRGFQITHDGQIFANAASVPGDDGRLFNGVTLGVEQAGSLDAPRWGNNVQVAAGATIIGPVSIGDNCRIGANAVATRSFPPIRSGSAFPPRRSVR
jgi:serine O-acetyltransferase